MRNHTMRIIAICGSKRSGKDTVSDYIAERYGYTKVKFASPLKRVCCMLFGYTEDQLESDAKDIIDHRYGCTPRHLMQFLGTDVMQFKIQEVLPSMGRNFWANHLLSSVPNTTPIVISDMRFQHEQTVILQHDPNAIIIKITRPNSTVDQCMHISELECKDIQAHVDIINDGCVDDLKKKIDGVMSSFEVNRT